MAENGNRDGATVSTHNKRTHTDTSPGAGDAQVVTAREPTCRNPPTGRLPRRKAVERKSGMKDPPIPINWLVGNWIQLRQKSMHFGISVTHGYVVLVEPANGIEFGLVIRDVVMSVSFKSVPKGHVGVPAGYSDS